MKSVDMDAILKKAKSVVNQKSNKPTNKNNSTYTIDDVANKFIQVLKDNIRNSTLTEDAIDSILHRLELKYEYSVESKGVVNIHIYFDGDTSRPSLYPEKYGGVDDITLLLNNGVDHTMNPVYGMWKGKYVRSKTDIEGQHFLENAKEEFKNKYSSIFNIIDIKIKGID